MVVGILFLFDLTKPIDPSNQQKVIVTIPEGSSTRKIADELKKHNLIKNELIFLIYVKSKGTEGLFKAGNYALSKSMAMREIIEGIVEGRSLVQTVKFTIPEGFTVEQIAEKLAEQGIISEQRFLSLAKKGAFDYEFLNRIPNDSEIKYRVEGYLFPKTYEVVKGATEEEIINVMLAQFQKEWSEKWNPILKKRRLTQHHVMTLASLIEKEARVDSERTTLAGVIQNRINKKMDLQIDATIQYILGKPKAQLAYRDLKVKSPYNTYINSGLPPGPIANPGIKSIEAALFPDPHDYYFYVTKKDGTGEHYFAKNYTDHQRNIAKSKEKQTEG